MQSHPSRFLTLSTFGLIAAVAGCGDQGPAGNSTDPAEIVVTPAIATLASLGQVVNAQASVRAADGTVLERNVVWNSSDPSVATVSSSGMNNVEAEITSVGDGSAQITATVASVIGGTQVVVAQTVAGLAFQVPPFDAVIGQTSGTVQVAAIDPGGSPVAMASGPVTLDQVAGPSGALQGDPRVEAMVSGLASFADVRLNQLGSNYQLRAQWDGRETNSNTFDIVAALDAVQLTNAAAGTVGILVDGFRGGAALNDLAVTSDQAFVEVGVVGPAPSGPNEIITFAPGRRPALTAASWSTGVDTAAVTLSAPVEVDITVWVVQGPFSSQGARALNAIETTRSIWSDENAGLVIDSVEVIDATADPDASGLVQVTLCNSRSDLETLIGKKEGTLNVYYVETVDGGTDRGRACPIGGDHAVMAERSGDELLSHEIGHLLSLTHTDAIVQHFDRTNVMHSASSTRRYLTEGQVFRQQFDPNSVINNVFGIRSAEARPCSRDTANSLCPKIDGRIWQDGSFAPSFAAGSGMPVASSLVAAHQAELGAVGDGRTDVVELAHRWVEVSCEMDENEGLSARLQGAGGGAIQALIRIAERDSNPRHRHVALDGIALLGTPAGVAYLRSAEANPDLATPARAALDRISRDRR